MLKQFVRGDPREGERTAKTGLLLAGTPHLPRLGAIIDHALAVDVARFRAWNHLAKAMAEYRALQFDACIRHAGEAAAGLSQDAAGKLAADLFAAMAHHRLGQCDNAAAMLDEVSRNAELNEPKFGPEGTGPDFSVEDWLILHVALREAEALIRAKPSAGAAPG